MAQETFFTAPEYLSYPPFFQLFPFGGAILAIRVKMLVSIASADWSYIPQQEVELDDDLAQKWVSVGHAEYLDSPKEGVNDGTETNKRTRRRTSESSGHEAVPES